MCGIAAQIGNPDKKNVQKMTEALGHRGPDGSGIYTGENIVLGHRRLSIIDTSNAGLQPMKHTTKDIWVVFNGEIYNYIELKKELVDYQFRTETDTEVLLAAYEKWGMQCVNKFNGMFAFVIYDGEKKHIWGARDRLGIKPLYYTEIGDSVLIASEIKALIAGGYKPTPNEQIMWDYLSYGFYDHTNETFFQGVKSIPAGHTFECKDLRITTQRYWSVGDVVEQNSIELDDAIEQLQFLARDAIKLRLRSDVPIGVHFSGGFDSSALVTIANQNSKEPLQTYSFVYNEKEFDETHYIKEVIEAQKNPWKAITTSPEEAFKIGRKMVEMQDQPYGGLPTIAYQKMCFAEKIDDVKVILEGQGVDECFAGYGHYIGHYYRDLFRSGNIKAIRYEVSQLIHNSGVFTAMTDMVRYLKIAGDNTHHDGSRHTRPELVNQQYFKKMGVQCDKKFEEPFSDRLRNAQYKDIVYTKLPRVLRFNDHATMAVGRELRVPFLDHRIVEFGLAIHGGLKIKKQMGKYVFRKAMRDQLPRLNLISNKRSITTPQTKWFQNQLKKEIIEVIESESFRSRAWINAPRAAEMIKKDLQGSMHNSFYIWQMINLEWWFKSFID